LGASSCFYFAYFDKPVYKAELRFVVKSEGSGSGLSGMLGGLGSVLGGSSGSPLERTIEIAGSDRIVGSALLSEVQIDGRNEILANSLIRINKINEAWAKDSLLKNVQFTVRDSAIEQMDFPKRKAIKTLEAILIPKSGDGIISKSIDKKSGVVMLAATHENEDFAIVLTKEIFNKLRDFYVEQMTTSAVNNVLILQKKVDSIKFELAKVQSSFARTTDQSFGLLFQEDKVELKKLAVREQMLMAMYAEAQKNLETFKFMNDSAIPSLTVIDMPYSPLKKIQKSKAFYTAGGFFLGGFLTFLFILIRRWYKNLMAS
jgi:uncharacterized protein involved in exopolysaccharide biosynthesis